MSGESTTRFAHLLQPIRDLSKVWKIEIAEELEKYIEEVAELLVTNPEDGVTQLNFAEAALLIQGSTAIYSRKVELLYQLVYQALDLLVLDKSKDGKHKSKTVQSGLWAPIPETDELLTIDHLIKEGRHIVLDHNAPEQRQATQRRVPLFLMPRDQEDRRKHEFRISACTVHHSGCYLLQESDARLLDEMMGTVEEEIENEPCDAPLVPAPPKEVQELDDRLQELLREMPPEAPPPEEEPEEEASTPTGKKEGEADKSTPMKAKTPGTRCLVSAGKAQGILSANDPWSFLDEHETAGTDVPLVVGKTSKRVNAKKLLMTAEGLPDTNTCEPGNSVDDSDFQGVAPMLAAGHPVESLFVAVAGQMKAAGSRYETQRAGFGVSWLEFEDLFVQAASKRKLLKASVKKVEVEAAPKTPTASDDEGAGSDAEMPQDRFATPMKGATPFKGDMGMTPLGIAPTEEQLRREEQRKEVARLETMIQDAQGKYEATIRNHLHSMQKDGAESIDSKFPQLYANVRRWQDQLEPVLKEFESRPEFNIHEYSTKFLDKMTNIPQSSETQEGDDRMIKFSRLVFGQPRWEICRRFLTCLILTNQGNTDIVASTAQDRLNEFSIKLLKAERKMISLDSAEDDMEKVVPAPGRGKKKAASSDAVPAGNKKQKIA